MLPKSYQIETERFSLRINNEIDFPLVYSASRYPGFTDGLLWRPPESEEELIQPLLNNLKAWEEGSGYGFTIVKKGSTDLIGRISIRKTDVIGLWNVGFWTHPEEQRKGVMTEALEAMLRFGFEELAADKIEACYAIWNKASEKVLVRNGMIMERFLEQGFKKKGQWVAENLFSIDKLRWKRLSFSDK